jgi:SAM-dependent methyltransferase
MQPTRRYLPYHEFPGWWRAPDLLEGMIEKFGANTVLEIGSGANPTLKATVVAAFGLRYVTTDIDDRQLAKAPSGYEARVLDLETGQLPDDLSGECDLVFSRMVSEHVRNGEKYHRNVFNLLRPGGVAVHCFSTLYALPFVANATLPERAADRLLDLFAPRDRHRYDKFGAHYSWCRGPTLSMIRRFENVGYEVVQFDGYFGHGYYKRRLPLLHRLEHLKMRALLAHPVPQLCAYGLTILRRPQDLPPPKP